MPESSKNSNDGAIEFTQKGTSYPGDASQFTAKIIKPKTRDLNIFPSSLFHRTFPFKGEKQRICIAFDLVNTEQ